MSVCAIVPQKMLAARHTARGHTGTSPFSHDRQMCGWLGRSSGGDGANTSVVFDQEVIEHRATRTKSTSRAWYGSVCGVIRLFVFG